MAPFVSRSAARRALTSVLLVAVVPAFALTSCGSDEKPLFDSDGSAAAGTGGAAGESVGGSATGGRAGTDGGAAGEGASGGSAGRGGSGGKGASGSGGIGTAGDGGAAGGDTDPISLTRAEFTAYGELTLDFSDALPGDVEVELTPERPSGFVVRDVEVSGSRARVTLGHNQLPLDYDLTVRVLDEAGALVDEFARALPAASTKSLLAFLSAASGNGDMRTWTAAPSPTPASPIVAGNAICQAEAEAEGFSGTFVAYLPTGADDGVCLALGLDGKAADDCGRGGAFDPPDYAWVRPDGVPSIAHLSELGVGGFRTRLLHIDAASALSGESAWIGKAVSQASTNQPCQDWTLSTSAEGTLIFQRFDATLPFRLNINSGLCDTLHQLVCLQQAATGTPMTRAHARPGRRVFTTTAETIGALSAPGPTTGVPAGDRICSDEANAAGLSSSTGWAAWLSDSAADAGCHIDGLTGTMASSCNGGARPADRAFVRADGVVLATGLTDLLDGELLEPAALTASEGSPDGHYVWTGTDFRGVGTGADCTDFASNSDVGSRGIVVGTGFWSSTSGAQPCNTPYHLLCFER